MENYIRPDSPSGTVYNSSGSDYMPPLENMDKISANPPTTTETNVPSNQVSRAYPTVLSDGGIDGYGKKRSKRRRYRHNESSNHSFSDFAKIPAPSVPFGATYARRQDDPRIPSDLADRLAMAEREETRAETRRLLGEHNAQPDYSQVQKKRLKAFGAKNVEIPRELLERTRPPRNIRDRAQMRKSSVHSLNTTLPSSRFVRTADDNAALISVPLNVSSETVPVHLRHEHSWDEYERAVHNRHPEFVRELRSTQSSQPSGSNAQHPAQSPSTASHACITKPEALRALPVGASYQSAANAPLSSSPLTTNPTSTAASSDHDGHSFTGRYYRHRFTNIFRRLRQRRRERKDAMYKAKYDKLHRKMQDKHDAIELRRKNSKDKIDRKKTKEMEKRARTRQKFRRRRERAWSSAEGRGEDELSVQGIHARDFAMRRERGRPLTRQPSQFRER